MKRKILFTVFALTIILFAASIASTVAANRGQTKKEYVDYKFEAILVNPVTKIISPAPNLVVEGYRPASGIQSCVVTINDIKYSYPEDFDYAENFTVKMNLITGKGILEVVTSLTFKMPGKPTLTEYLTVNTTVTSAGTLAEGTFYLIGTKTFNQVVGFGIEPETYTTPGIDNALHIGQITGWPF